MDGELIEEISSVHSGIQDIESALKIITSIDSDVTYSSEKLLNLHVLLMHLLAWDNDFDATAWEDGYLSLNSLEKALEFDFLCDILDSEVREVESFLDSLPAKIADAYIRTSSCRNFGEVHTVMEEKLRKCEELLKQSQKQALEVKMLLDKLHRNFATAVSENWENDKRKDLSDYGQLLNVTSRSKMRTTGQPKYVLRMLEKSLGRELALEKKLLESRQNEEDLKRKLHYTEQVAFHMEEAAEVVWRRFLEAENASEVLMGISKEMVGRNQIAQFNLNGSMQREAELKSRLDDCFEQLRGKDIALQNLESLKTDYDAKSSEVLSLREKVKLLEERLKESNDQLVHTNAICETNEHHINEMEIIMESLKETIDAAESRAEAAEGKVTQLNDTNMELTEECNELKGSVASKSEKVSLLENQVRDLEIQLQHSKASSEASQEQQNMLYSAIWDMETLIEDLKSKVSKAESKADTAEEQCIILSEANFELNQELSLLREKVEDLERSLDEANSSKYMRSDEINLKTKVIMDMVMQLAYERERIQKQLQSLTKENALLVKKLQNVGGESFVHSYENGKCDLEDSHIHRTGPSEDSSGETAEKPESLPKALQMDNQLNYSTPCESTATESTETPFVSASNSSTILEMRNIIRKYIIMALFVTLISIIVSHMLKENRVSDFMTTVDKLLKGI